MWTPTWFLSSQCNRGSVWDGTSSSPPRKGGQGWAQVSEDPAECPGPVPTAVRLGQVQAASRTPHGVSHLGVRDSRTWSPRVGVPWGAELSEQLSLMWAGCGQEGTLGLTVRVHPAVSQQVQQTPGPQPGDVMSREGSEMELDPDPATCSHTTWEPAVTAQS